MGIETQIYENEALIAGKIISNNIAPLGVDTWHYGMPCKYDPTTNVYLYEAATPEAIYIGEDARVLGSIGVGPVIEWGEVFESGIVDSAGATLAIDPDVKNVLSLNGIYLK